MIFLELFISFLIIGAFTFGGGYSMVALIQDEVVVKQGWMTAQEFTDMLAISQMTPGPIGINTATYAGYTAVANAGFSPALAVCGSLVASVAVVAVPVLLVLLLSRYLLAHMESPLMAAIFRVLRLAVVGLIAAAALSLVGGESFGEAGLNLRFIVSAVIFLAVFILSYRYKTSPILLIVASGLAGLLVYSF